MNQSDTISIHDLKHRFSQLKEGRNTVMALFDAITTKIQKLNMYYEELIRANKQHLFVIGLDTFHFQKQLLNIEYDSLSSHHNMVSNRVYCDYYKMYKIIKKYIVENINEPKLFDQLKAFLAYPVYDNLNIHKVYSFESIHALYHDVVDLLLSLKEHCNNQSMTLKNYQTKQNFGLNINNFVYTFENQIQDVLNKVDLFNNYMHYFVSLHIKYYSKFLTKIRLMFSQINHEIKFDETTLNNRQTKENLIQELKNEMAEDKDILDQINQEIGGVLPTLERRRSSTFIPRREEIQTSTTTPPPSMMTVEDPTLSEKEQSIIAILTETESSYEPPIVEEKEETAHIRFAYTDDESSSQGGSKDEVTIPEDTQSVTIQLDVEVPEKKTKKKYNRKAVAKKE